MATSGLGIFALKMNKDKAPLHMVDVLGQYARIAQEIDSAVLDVVKSGQYINGPAVRDFSKDLALWLGHTDEKPIHVIPCANGTDALQAAFMALGLRCAAVKQKRKLFRQMRVACEWASDNTRRKGRCWHSGARQVGREASARLLCC